NKKSTTFIAQATELAKPNGMRAVESESKDLLQKVKLNRKHFSAFIVYQLCNIWDIIDGSYVLPDEAAEVESVEYEEKPNQAKSQHPSGNVEYAGVDYETKKWSNTIDVRFRFCSLRYDLKTDMLKHITRVRATIRELIGMSKAMSESEVVEWLLIALPDSAVVKGRRGTANIHLLRNGKRTTLKLHDVTYEPTIYKNLISHVLLLRSGYQLAHQILKKKTYVHLFNGHELHFAMSDSLYAFQDVAPRAATGCINVTKLATDKTLDPPSDAKLHHWYNKLSHTDMRQVAKIIQPILLPGIDSSTTNHTCDGCAQGQAKRVSFRNTHHYVPAYPLEYLNGDLCGPASPRTVNHELFASMFIDQASRYIFGKLLKTKDDTILHLDALVSDLNSQLPHARVRMLHTDGGEECTSSAFKAACLARGIHQKFTNVETPEENHLAEKANEFVFNKIRTYLTISSLLSTLNHVSRRSQICSIC
ncbi:hypothetical protein DYB38_011721, partial [Aphanomyces astaci]